MKAFDMNWENTIPAWENIETIANDMIVFYIKQWRKAELASTDYTQLPDVPLNNKLDWATYRQALRDLPQQGPDPKLWVFPVPPT